MTCELRYPSGKKAVEVLEMVEVAEKQLDFLSVDFNICTIRHKCRDTSPVKPSTGSEWARQNNR